MIQIQDSTHRQKALCFVDVKAINRLEELGLSFNYFEEAFKKAIQECMELPSYSYCMETDTKMICATIRNFRKIMSTKGWLYDDSNKLNKSFPANKNFVLIFASGNENVGNPYETPTTKSKKGETYKDVIYKNKVVQLHIEFPEEVRELKLVKKNSYWFCLFRKIGNKVRAEISLTDNFIEEGDKIRICDWVERIILPEIEYCPRTKQKGDKPQNSSSCYDKEKELNITRKTV